MITLNNVLNLFKDIADRHRQINDYEVSQDFNIDADDAPIYPILVVNPITASLPRTENGFTTRTITLELQVVDLLNKDLNNEDDVLSDTMQIINDVVNEFNTAPYYIENSIDVINDISFDTLRGVYDSDVTGWKCTLEIETPNNRSYCSAPID